MTDEFSKKTVKKFGPRGSPVFEQEQKTTDLETLQERVDQTTVPFCECGAPITATDEVYRCSDCDLLCCNRCHIELSRWQYCPTCARRRFGLDKRTFLALVFLQHDRMGLDDLVTVTTDPDGTVIELEFDAIADTLVEYEYLTDDGNLSPDGLEALSVGRRLYGGDQDIQAVLEQIRLKEVVDGA